MTLVQATQACGSIGARLCYPTELGLVMDPDSEDACDGAAEMRVWTSSLCRTGGNVVGHLSQGGVSGTADTTPARCSQMEELLNARCCADLAMPPPSPPLRLLDAPAGVHAGGATCTSLSLSWEPPPYTPPSGPLDYAVAWIDASADDSVPGDEAERLVVTAPTLQVDRLSPGETYTFWVAARNGLGLGAWSRPVEVATIPPTRAPDAPIEPALAAGDSCDSLELYLPDRRTDGCASDEALALQIISAAVPVWTTTQHTTGTRVLLGQLDSAQAYRFRLIAFNRAGGSAPSAEVGPFLTGTTAERMRTPPDAWATSSASIALGWSQLAAPCRSAGPWRVMYLPSGSDTWRVLERQISVPRLRRPFECPAGCSFKVMPIIDGWTLWSNPSPVVSTAPMAPLQRHAVRVSLSLAVSPDDMPFDPQTRDAFCDGLASVLGTERSRFLLVEARPLDSSWTVVLDIVPPPAAKPQFALENRPADRSATTLAEALAGNFIGGGALLSACVTCRLLNLSHGVQRMIQTPDGRWTGITLHFASPPSPPARGGSTVGSLSWPLGLAAAAAALAVGLWLALRSRDRQAYAKVDAAETAEGAGMLGSRAIRDDGLEAAPPYVIADREEDTGEAVQFF